MECHPICLDGPRSGKGPAGSGYGSAWMFMKNRPLDNGLRRQLSEWTGNSEFRVFGAYFSGSRSYTKQAVRILLGRVGRRGCTPHLSGPFFFPILVFVFQTCSATNYVLPPG